MAVEKTQAPKTEEQPAAQPAPAPAQGGMTNEQLAAFLQGLVGMQQSSNEELANAIGRSMHEANAKARKWYNEDEFPDISPFNPLGELANPRPKFERIVMVHGHRCQEEQHTAAEIELLNKLKAGLYAMRDEMGTAVRHAYFEVRNLDPGMPDGRLMLTWPAKSEDERSAHAARYSRGKGMVDMLKDIVDQIEQRSVLTV